MKVTLESTTQTTTVNGVPARIWQGTTESGIPVSCLITRIAAHADNDLSQFEAELTECKEPTMEGVFPLRMVL